MFMFMKIIVLGSLIRMLFSFESPLLCAGIYTGFVAVMSIFFWPGFLGFIIGLPLSFLLALIYFVLLNRFQDTWIFWLIAFIGILIGLV